MEKRAFVKPGALLGVTPGKNYPLDKETTHRFKRVLRLEEGAWVELFDGTGHVLQGQVNWSQDPFLENIKIEKKELPAYEAILVQALTKMEKLEQIVKRCTELGVTQIWLAETERCQFSWKDKDARKLVRLERIAEDAARQSGRIDVPLIKRPEGLSGVCSVLKVQNQLKVFGDVQAHSSFKGALEESGGKADAAGVVVAVGPEGGFSKTEKTVLLRAGFQSVQWARYTLRTETAGMASLAVFGSYLS